MEGRRKKKVKRGAEKQTNADREVEKKYELDALPEYKNKIK